jgi:hypothetical protein
MSKIDFKRELDSYRATKRFRIVEVPKLQYLMIDGRGDPNTEAAYIESIQALFPLAYALKFASKRELSRDYVVMPLEGLWWSADMASFTTERDKSRWEWTLMMMLPDWITAELFDDAVNRVGAASQPARLDLLRHEVLAEGPCVQTLHVGPYDDEAPVLDRMHTEFIPENGLTMTGKHHEIYLSDARKVAPERLRTILRQPVITAQGA